MTVNETTDLLCSSRAGDPVAANALMLRVYHELRAVAERFLARERPDHTLQPTELVHEVYLKLVDQTRVQWADENHFVAVAAEAMRRALVDHARRVQAEKRGGGWQRITLGALVGVEDPETARISLVALGDALDKLATLSDRRRRVVELKFFAGLPNERIAETLGISRSTVADDWTVAKAWLRAEMSALEPQ